MTARKHRSRGIPSIQSQYIKRLVEAAIRWGRFEAKQKEIAR